MSTTTVHANVGIPNDFGLYDSIMSISPQCTYMGHRSITKDVPQESIHILSWLCTLARLDMI